MAAIPVTITLTFHVDPEAWEMAYAEPATAENLRGYFGPVEGMDMLPPAADEWVTDTDQTEVKVEVGGPIGP